jgi:Rps23 Pro-64 3,4-dihydroxylase Tpa1-like proline 4-hydroxylase
MVEQATLRLKDGGRRRCVLPSSVIARAEFMACVRAPEHAGEKVLRLAAPEGGMFEVAARDIAGLEVPPPYFLIRDFLAPEDWDRAFDYALAREAQFLDATISLPATQNNSAPDYRFRRSRILNDVEGAVQLILPRLRGLMPDLLPKLGMGAAPLSRMECQITAHGDGDFFNTHTDNGLPDIAHRRVSYVYYFHREPKAFTGGHLRIYDTLIEGLADACGPLTADIDPPGNSLAIFPSHCHHEVTAIHSASEALADQRLTINGWLCT